MAIFVKSLPDMVFFHSWARHERKMEKFRLMTENSEVRDAMSAFFDKAEARLGGRANLCERCNVPSRTYGNWKSFKSEPGFMGVLRIAAEADLSLDTLVWPDRTLVADSAPDMKTVLDAAQGLEEFLISEGMIMDDPIAKRKLTQALAEMAWKDRNSRGTAEVVNFMDYAPFMRAAAHG